MIFLLNEIVPMREFLVKKLSSELIPLDEDPDAWAGGFAFTLMQPYPQAQVPFLNPGFWRILWAVSPVSSYSS